MEISIEEVQESTGIPVVARVREDKVVPLSLFERVPATLFARDTKFSKEIGRLSRALTGKKERRSLASILLGTVKREQVNRELLRQSFYRDMFE